MCYRDLHEYIHCVLHSTVQARNSEVILFADRLTLIFFCLAFKYIGILLSGKLSYFYSSNKHNFDIIIIRLFLKSTFTKPFSTKEHFQETNISEILA